MISTVTTTTVTTVAVAGSFAIISVLVLLSLLIQKELTTASPNDRLQRLGKLLNIGIIPLLIAFAMFVIAKIADVIK
jgi:NADH:ubiquinone oxidoreductase subunit H